MPYTSAQDIINDALFRTGEIPGASEWDTKALDYLNRVYQGICSGASEFLPEFIEDWWWLRSSGVLTIEPVYSTGTIALTKGSTAAVFAPAPANDLDGYKLRVPSFPDILTISAHTAGATAATLDGPWNGETDSYAFQAMKTTYTLPATVAAIISPVISFRDNPQIMGMSPERMDRLFPLQALRPGIPQAFALETEQTLRFSSGGRNDGVSMRMEFRYRPIPTTLQNLSNSIPLIPSQWRHVLSDGTTMYIMVDKNDDRAVGIGTAVRAVLSAMVRENRRRIAKMDGLAGKIITRPALTRHPLRTESGLIIG